MAVAANIETIVVEKRFHGELTDVRDFIRPRDFMVRDLVASRDDWTPRSMLQWVVENINYPAGGLLTRDWSAMLRFRWPVLPIPRKFYSSVDLWEFPAEVLRDRIADCEGMTFLLVSMLRNRFPELRAFATVGFYRGYGHVWTTVQEGRDWRIYEATLSWVPEYLPTEQEAADYEPIFRFNEQTVLIETEELIVPERIHELGKDQVIRSWYRLIERRGV